MESEFEATIEILGVKMTSEPWLGGDDERFAHQW